jgi:glycosyltransferase involved in cell wall biosynthesis
MKHKDTNHTFAVCAYQDSPYLEKCLRSLVEQEVPTNIILCTSTPSPYIQNLADWYDIPVYVREGKSDIQDDWNFAYDMAKTQYVTIAHQDDVYMPDYTKVLFRKIKKYKDMSIFFCHYITLEGTKPNPKAGTARVKRLLCQPVSFTWLADRKWLKKSCLCLGNGISCPMVTYNKNIVGQTIFQSKLKYALDWEMFYKIAEKPGRFVYVKEPHGYYRVHGGATSAKFIQEMSRRKEAEDTEMFRHFWPGWLTKLIMIFYKKSYQAYK